MRRFSATHTRTQPPPAHTHPRLRLRRLVPAHTAVSVGASSAGGSAGRLLGRLDPRCLTLAHPGLPEPVSAWLGCPRLSDVAEERLDPQHGLQPVEEMQVCAVGGGEGAHVRGG